MKIKWAHSRNARSTSYLLLAALRADVQVLALGWHEIFTLVAPLLHTFQSVLRGVVHLDFELWQAGVLMSGHALSQVGRELRCSANVLIVRGGLGPPSSLVLLADKLIKKAHAFVQFNFNARLLKLIIKLNFNEKK